MRKLSIFYRVHLTTKLLWVSVRRNKLLLVLHMTWKKKSKKIAHRCRIFPAKQSWEVFHHVARHSICPKLSTPISFEFLLRATLKQRRDTLLVLDQLIGVNWILIESELSVLENDSELRRTYKFTSSVDALKVISIIFMTSSRRFHVIYWLGRSFFSSCCFVMRKLCSLLDMRRSFGSVANVSGCQK